MLLILICICAEAQQPDSDIATVTLPKGAVKLTKEQAIDYVHKNYKHPIGFKNPNNVYSIDGTIVSFQDEINAGDYKLTLQDQKRQMESIFKKSHGKSTQSEIVTVNHMSFFVFEYEENGSERDLSFLSDFKNNKAFYCIVHYKASNINQAKNVFYSILNSFQYKN